MSTKKIITIVSIIVTTLVIATAAVLIINKNNKTTKASVVGNNMDDTDEILEGGPLEDPEETTTNSPKPSTSPSPIIPAGKYYIKVNNQMNTVTVYTKDEEGNYTIPVKAMVCSTGYSSPKNTKHRLTSFRRPFHPMKGGVYAQYVTQIYKDVCFHSVPYFKKDKATLEYKLYDKLGTTCSAGCIRLVTSEAKWIYENCAAGTVVEFYSSSDPGPLGKPSAQKISSSGVPFRNWDPTDPDPNNPWRNVSVVTPETEPSDVPTIIEQPSVQPENTPTVAATVTLPSVAETMTQRTTPTPTTSTTITTQPTVPTATANVTTTDTPQVDTTATD